MTGIVAENVKKYRQLIAGEWVDAEGGRTFDDLNPYSGEVFAEIPASNGTDARHAIEAAHQAFAGWAAMGARARQALFLKAADIVERRANELVMIMAQETGAASPFSRFQIQWAVGLLRQAAAASPFSLGAVPSLSTPPPFS